jgi:hypothetical protein
VATQERVLRALIRRAAGTRFGRDYAFASIRDVADFQARVPLRNYDAMWSDYWQAAFPRLDAVSWPGPIRYLALSSGTTTGKTKYLPITRAMRRSNARGGFDLLAHHFATRPHSHLFGGKTFMLGGSTALIQEAPGILSGDLSGIAVKTLPLWARPYVFPKASLALSSCAGAFGYVLGDTVRLVDRSPPRLLITGRTSYGLSAFGEHLIAEEIESAVAAAASAIGADVTDYSVGAVFPQEGQPRGGHLYVVEFAGGAPDENALKRFREILDSTLLRLNDDYRGHRAGEFGMLAPDVRVVAPGTFARWMKSRGKLGGQHKVPRVINDRKLWNNLVGFVAASERY